MSKSQTPSPAATAQGASTTEPTWDHRFAVFLYRWRWLSSALALAAVIGAFLIGGGRIGNFSNSVAGLGDTTNGSGVVQPLVFDPSLDVWFGAQDASVETYYEIEDRFVAEDFIMVTFEVPDHPFGVFSRQSLATIHRLTERFLTVPGVRHVRSLTYNPWIRWGEINDDLGSEAGLIISDLVEGDPNALDDDEIVERMVAVLGAERVAERLGDERVRQVLGEEADFADHIGEPLLLGTILDAAGGTTAIQVQVLRPRVSEDTLIEALDDSSAANLTAAANLYSAQYQRAALRGIQHFLRLEAGLALPTAEYAQLRAWVDGLPEGEEKEALRRDLDDPTRNFMTDAQGQQVRKFYEYDPVARGKYVDHSHPAQPVEAAAGFRPQPTSDFDFHLGGVPLFELNFEEVGMADARFIPLMFMVIALCLLVIFRHWVGIVAPFAVVMGGIMAMVGTAFAMGDLFNNLTMMSPNMLTAVGIADAIHLVAAWAVLRSRYDNRRDLIVEVLRRNALPVLLTSITTAVGFYSLMVSALAPVTMLGYTAGLGTLIAYVLSMTMIPALLSLVPTGKKVAHRRPTAGGLFSTQRSERFTGWVLRHRLGIVGLATVWVLVSFYGLSQVEIDTDFRGMFPDANPTMSDFRWIEDRMGGVGDLEIIFTGVSGPDAGALSAEEDNRLAELRLRQAGLRQGYDEFTPLSGAEEDELKRWSAAEEAWNAGRIGVSPEFLTTLDRFESRLRQEMADSSSPLHVVTDLISPLDILRKMHQVQHENRASWYRVPREEDVPDALRQPSLTFDEWSDAWSLVPAQDGSSLVAQYYLQYENGARPGENLTTQLSADRTQFRMQGRVMQASSVEHRAAFERIEEIAAEEFPELTAQAAGLAAGEGLSDLTLSGKTLLFARTTHLFSMGFVQSMSIALLAITLIIGLIFRSLRLALVSLLPNVLPIVMPLSVFGLLGLPLHGPAILVSSVALGVCVDDTIHFFAKYVRVRRQGMDMHAALAAVMHQVGPALSITTGVLMIGFSTLLLSDFTPNRMMGALATVMIGLAWVADFILTPAALSLTSRRAAEPATAQEIDSVPLTAPQ